MMRKLNEDVLDLLENRMLQSMLGEIDELPAATLEIFRKVLIHNGRLTANFKQGAGTSLDVPGGDLEGEDIPDYGGKVIDFK